MSVSPSVDMLPFGVNIPATVPQGSEIPEGLMNNPVLNWQQKCDLESKKCGNIVSNVFVSNLNITYKTP